MQVVSPPTPRFCLIFLQLCVKALIPRGMSPRHNYFPRPSLLGKGSFLSELVRQDFSNVLSNTGKSNLSKA